MVPVYMKMLCVMCKPREYGGEKRMDRSQRRREGNWKQVEKTVGRDEEETSKRDNIGGCEK
jgi:hypothetical protein